MRWTMTWEELTALQELAGGVCVEPGEAIWEKLMDKGLASPEDGLVRSSVAGEVVLEALEGQSFEPRRMTVVTLEEEPWTEPEPVLPTIDDFF